MTVPFMRAYTERLVQVCHQHDAHAMGGMAAFIPSRRDENVNKMAFEKVRQDKEREVADGFDGTWVAHPDLVPFAKETFMKVRTDQVYLLFRQQSTNKKNLGWVVQANPGLLSPLDTMKHNLTVEFLWVHRTTPTYTR